MTGHRANEADAIYESLSLDVAASEMTEVVACARRDGIDLEADPVNGGYYSALPVADQSSQDPDVATTIRNCEAIVYGQAAPVGPASDDAELLFGLYAAQAECLVEAGYAVGSGPTQTDFVNEFAETGVPPWQPFDSDERALVDWAERNSETERTAYDVLLTRCPDPARMWRYVLRFGGE